MKQDLRIRIVFDRTHVATLSTDANPRPGLIQLEARYNGRKVYRAIASVYLDQFGRYNKRTHTTTGETVCNRYDAERINGQIQTLRAAMLADFDRCKALGLTYSLDRIATATNTDNRSFAKWADEYIQKMPVSESTRTSKRSILKTITAANLFYSFSDLTPANVLSFDRWLHAKQRLHTSRTLSAGYIHNVHGFLHTLSTNALHNGLIYTDPYKDFKNPKTRPQPRPWLTPEQIRLIADAPCIDTPGTHVSLRDARDLFLLQIFTGLAYIDVQRAPWNTARQSGILSGQRTKTRTTYIVRISPAARAILERWDWCPPRLSSISLNESLQLIVCQAITGCAAVGLRDLCDLPASLIDKLKKLPVSPRTSDQHDARDLHNLILLLIETGATFESLRRADLSVLRRGGSLHFKRGGGSYSVTLSTEALRLLDLLQWHIPNVSGATITNTLRRLIVSTQIPALSTHIGRHTFGTVAINAGVPVAVLQRIMGHTDPNTTLIYAKLQPDTILDAFSLIDPATDPDPNNE